MAGHRVGIVRRGYPALSIIHQASTTAAQAGSTLHQMIAGTDSGSFGFRTGLFNFGTLLPVDFRGETFSGMFTSGIAGPNNTLIINLDRVGVPRDIWSSIRFLSGANWEGLIKFQDEANYSPDVIGMTQWSWAPAVDPPFVNGQTYDFVMNF